MISLQSADYTLSASDTKTITVDVPAETDNCFMKIYVLDNSIQRNPYQQSVFVGSRILQGGIYPKFLLRMTLPLYLKKILIL